jgi:hypothetical protein
MSDDDILKGVEGEGHEWEEAPDPTPVSEEELGAPWKELSEEERAISYRRRVFWDRGASLGEGG